MCSLLVESESSLSKVSKYYMKKKSTETESFCQNGNHIMGAKFD